MIFRESEVLGKSTDSESSLLESAFEVRGCVHVIRSTTISCLIPPK